MYWTDRFVNRVIRAHKWHGENQTVMLYNLPQPMGLVAVHPARQPAGRPRPGTSSHSILMLCKNIENVILIVTEARFMLRENDAQPILFLY